MLAGFQHFGLPVVGRQVQAAGAGPTVAADRSQTQDEAIPRQADGIHAGLPAPPRPATGRGDARRDAAREAARQAAREAAQNRARHAAADGAGPTAASTPGSLPRLRDLPGHASFREVERLRDRLGGAGRISAIAWTLDAGSGDGEDAGAVEFTRDGERFACELGSGRILPMEQVEREAAQERRGRTMARPARGRQSTQATSPDGRWIASCVDHNVVIEEAREDDVDEAAPPRRIVVTTDGTAKLGYGRASWVYGEELDQDSAMWWSPDSSALAFYRFDDREVLDFPLPVDWTSRRPRITWESYPKPGEPNPIADLLVHHMGDGKLVSIEVGDDPQQYVYAVEWSGDGRELLFLRTNRRQDVLELVAADPHTGKSRVVHTERQETFQNNRPTMRLLGDGRRFIWETERSGWAQYELRDLDGNLLVELTAGEFPVLGIEKLDEEAGWLYYRAASGTVPIATQLHRVRLDGTEETRLTPSELSHGSFDIAPDHRHFICSREAIDTPRSTVLMDMQGREIATLAQTDPLALAELGLSLPERFEFLAADGQTRLWGALYRPRHFDPSRSYPLLVDVYGGPGVRGLQDRWEGARAECEFGFLVAKLENRGTMGRGKAFETATYLKLGQLDVDDQAAGVRHLAGRSEVDGARVGIFGASYGGTMSILALLRHPELFRAAVATSAVTDWRQYDTIYTERYMRTPEENEEGYDLGSAVKIADSLAGPQPWRLLILHGMVDDNVHVTNAWQLVRVLQRRDIPFEMMFFPEADHSIGGDAARGSRWRFLIEALGAQPLPKPASKDGGAQTDQPVAEEDVNAAQP